MNRLYAVLDTNPVIFAKNDAGDIVDAYWFAHNVWMPVNSSDVAMNATLLEKDRFEQMFPGLPQLPITAFQA